MQENVRKQVRNAREKKRRRRKLYAVIACFSILVAGIVSWQLIVPGIAMSGATYCGKEEHTHSEACYGQAVVCGQEEGAGAHTHAEACYTQVRTEERICGQEESAGHVHADACYGLVCGQEESEEHQHTDGCYGLTCGQEEGAGAHTHTDECYATEKRLTCGQEESAGHVHTDTCYGTGTELICGMEEHTHTTACYSNPAAVETEDEWKAAFADCELTGQWGTDAAAIAESQIGYRESTENYSVTKDGSTKGYTRYADWAGDDIYGDWDTYFAAFVLNYAGVPTDKFPVNTDSLNEWITDMEGSGYYTTDKAADIQAGDLVILNKQDQDREQQIGIIREVKTDNDGNVTSIQVVEGNVDNAVVKNEYGADSSDIVGYGLVSKAYVACAGVTDQQGASGENEGNNIEKRSGENGNILSGMITFFSDLTKNGNNSGGVNQRLTINTFLTSGELSASTETGEPLTMYVNATYSGANQDGDADVWISLGTLPEGLSLQGFDANGEHRVVSGNETIILHLETIDGECYVHFTLPQGATANFDLEFESENGIMPKKTDITVEADKERTTIGGGGWDNTKDTASSGVTLTWTADNEWDPVMKKVNGVDSNTIAVHADTNNLSGTLIYTITAIGHNHDDTGAIWTDHIEITDTLSFENNIWFPDDAVIEGGQVKTVSGEVIMEFTKLQGGTVSSLEWKTDPESGKRIGITYELNIPNQNLNDTSLTDREQSNLDLEMRVYSQYLKLTDNYYQVSSNDDIIRNHVDFTAVPYKNYDDITESEDEVTTIPQVSDEEAEFTKEADKSTVQAGETIQYTITFKNTGDRPIDNIDDEGKLYTVTDMLPVYLTLTQEQICSLPSNAVYNAETNTITWTMTQEEEIAVGKEFQLVFNATVKDADDPVMAGLGNGSTIRNTANYKGFTTDEDIEYAKVVIDVEKTSEGTQVENGGQITYRIEVTNPSSVDATEQSVFTDTLPSGLTFAYAQFSEGGDHVTENRTYQVTSEKGNNYDVAFSVENDTLFWTVDPVKSGDALVFFYTCNVNTDEIEGGTLTNRITGDDGSEDSDVKPVKYPITVDKSVEQDTSIVYGDESIFDYTLTINNDMENPSLKENLEIVDTLPSGMLPYGYELLVNGQNTGLTWEEFVNGYIDQSAEYTTVINNETVKVTRDNGRVVLTWTINGTIPAGGSIVKTYQAQIKLTEDQKNGTAVSFTNTVRVDQAEDSVTVYGGDGSRIAIAKNIYVNINNSDLFASYNVSQIGEDNWTQMQNVKFTIERVDGQPIVASVDDIPEGERANISVSEDCKTLTVNYLTQFTWNADQFYTIPITLEAGKYTIKEIIPTVSDYTLYNSQYRLNGSSSATDYTPDEGFTVTIGDGQTTQISLDNRYRQSGEASVDLQKSVWGIAKKALYNNYPTLSSKNLFAIDLDDPNQEDYMVAYSISIVNTGISDVTIYELTDELPEGLTFVSLRSGTGNEFSGAPLNEIADYHVGNAQTELEYNSLADVFIKKTSENDTGRITFSVKDRSNENPLVLQSGQATSFLIVCSIDDNVTEDVSLTNTASIKVDANVQQVDYPEIKTKNTPYDAIQNNGSATDEGVGTDGYRVISSSVDITPTKGIVPGITKEAVSYFNYTDTVTDAKDVPDNKIIASDSIVKWEIRLYNDGTIDMENYSVEDAVTAPFVLITEEQAEKARIIQRFTLQKYDDRGNKDGTPLDVSRLYEEINGEDGKNTYRFKLNGGDYAIKAGGYAVLTIYTYYDATNYQTYVNNAAIYPEQEFDAHKVEDGHGELVRDENGIFTGVQSSAYVYALGAHGSVSWKEIEEKEDSFNWATGTPSTGERNYITVETADDIVTYTNNITNVSSSYFDDMVIVDRLPGINDRGAVNWQDQRGSEFSVAYIMATLQIKVISSDEIETVLDSASYTIEFSDIPVDEAYSDADFNGINSNRWHDTWQEGDTSFRIVMADNFQLAPGATLEIIYNGKISDDANPGQIAWNSFGYRYTVGTITLTAEPPKVGVMIQADAVIRKVVVDSENNDLGADTDIKFDFELYKESNSEEGELLASFEVAQGGYVRFSEITDNDGNAINLKRGQSYTLKEVLSDDSCYQLKGIGLDGGQTTTGEYTFIYNGDENLIIVARNQMDTYELPETGGIGTTGYLTGGAILMMSSCLLGGYRMRRKRERRDG